MILGELRFVNGFEFSWFTRAFGLGFVADNVRKVQISVILLSLSVIYMYIERERDFYKLNSLLFLYCLLQTYFRLYFDISEVVFGKLRNRTT